MIKKWRKHIFLFLTLIVVIIRPTLFYNEVVAEDEYSRNMEVRGRDFLTKFPEDTVFLIGKWSPMMVFYYIPFTGSRKEVISSGWSWPGKGLDRKVEEYIVQNKTIVIAPTLYNNNEIIDVNRVMKKYHSEGNLLQISDDLFVIEKMRSAGNRRGGVSFKTSHYLLSGTITKDVSDLPPLLRTH